MVRDFGIMLLELFNFSCYPQVEVPHLEERAQINIDSKVNDAKVVIDLAASCLLPHPSLRPSMQYVVHALRSLYQPRRLFSLPTSKLQTSSKSSSIMKHRCHSFG